MFVDLTKIDSFREKCDFLKWITFRVLRLITVLWYYLGNSQGWNSIVLEMLQKQNNRQCPCIKVGRDGSSGAASL